MKHTHKTIPLLLLAVSVLFASCSKDFKDDIDQLGNKFTGIDQRVANLEEQVSKMNTQLGQLSVLANAAEQGFYITEVKTTANGYELILSNGHSVLLQSDSNNWLTTVPSVSMTQLGGFFYWTLNGQLLTDGEGRPISSTKLAPVVKYDYKQQKWLISIDGGISFEDVNIFASVIINDTVLLQVINSYVSKYSSTFLSEELLFQIISTYIQKNYASLFNIDILNEVVVNYVNKHYAKIFSYELLEKIFSQYNYEYYTSQIDINELINLIVAFIREHKEVLVSNEILYEIISNYIEVNKVTIFDKELLLEVVTNFIQNNENFIDVQLLTQVINNYIELHQDVIFNTEVVKTLIFEYIQKYYTQVFSQNILVQVLNTYVTKNSTTIFNKAVIEETIDYYLKNNFNNFISKEVVYEILNNYVTKNSTTIINREVLYEVISNYFQKNYNLFIDSTVISQIINTYIEEERVTIISVEIIEQIIYRYVQQNYREIFNYDLLNQVIISYFEKNQQVFSQYVNDSSLVIKSLTVDSDKCVVTLNNGQTVTLVIFDAYARLRDRIQSIVVLPNEKGRINVRTEGGMSYIEPEYVISPSALAQIIMDLFAQGVFTLELIATDDDGEISTIPIQEARANDDVLSVSCSVQDISDIKTVALHVKDNQTGGSDIMTDFTPVGEKSSGSHVYLTCPDDNHPHMIDLGLPSGTLWACCNVGAATPSAFGDYYAWGETETKDEYSPYSYLYGTTEKQSYPDITYRDLGDNIAGTQYDVATVKWGSPWCMPTQEQCQELIDYCDLSGDPKGGYVFIGQNGGRIQIPNAGYHDAEKYAKDTWSKAYLWTSTPYNMIDNSPYAYSLNLSTFGKGDIFFDNKWIGWDAMYRYVGRSVRPVAAP